MNDNLKGQLGFGYLRISDDREGQELGVKRQEEDVRKLAADLGVTLVRIYCDNDISASTNTNEQRPDYEDMMAQLEVGPVKVVLSYTKARLTRKPEENERQIKLARTRGVSYFYVRGQALDLTVSANRKMDRIQNALDAGVAEDIQELALRKKIENAKEGKWDGGRRTYGYGKVVGYDPIKEKDICDPYQVREEEIAALKEGKRRILAGDSQFEIIRDWNRRGIRTTYGYEWEVGPLKRVLLNESYVIFDPTGHPEDCKCLLNPVTGGTRVHHDDRHRAKWPGVFTRAEHDAMAAVFNQRDGLWPGKEQPRGRSYLLSGLTVCGGLWKDTDKVGQQCGSYMYGQGKHYKTKRGDVYQRRYACRKWAKDGSRCGCCTVFRLAEPIEAFVTAQVLERFDSPDVLRALTPQDNEQRMGEVIQELAELQVRRTTLASEYANGDHDKSDYRVMMDTIKSKVAVLESEKKQLTSVAAKNLAIPLEGGLRDLWDDASLEWRASVIRLVVEKVIIHPGRSGTSKWPDKNGWRFNPDLIEIVWLV